MPLSPRLHVATIGAPHGVKGDVRVKSFTSDPLALKDYGALQDESGSKAFSILALRLLKDDMCVARFKDVSDRNAAAALTHARLFALRANMPALADGEYFHADLIGLQAETRDGTLLGDIVAVQNFGAGDLLEIAPHNGGETLLLPFASPFVGQVDAARGRVTVEPPAHVEAGSG